MKRLISIQWVLALAALLLAPQAALAEGESLSRLEGMESRLRALEDKLAASEATIAAQQQMLEQVQPAASAPAGSLAAFFDNLTVGGYVEASYLYNFNDPDAGINTQRTYQFNNAHNSFQLDALKLELGKAASEPGSAGFQFDIMLGENAKVLNNTVDSIYNEDDSSVFGDDEIFIQQGYVSYNWDGLVFKIGKFVTTIGYELIDAPYNPHVTHSELFFGAIPLFHTGLLAEGNLTEELYWIAGVTNGFNNSTDFNDDKGFLLSLGWTGEMASLRANGYYGNDTLRTSSRQGSPSSPVIPGAVVAPSLFTCDDSTGTPQNPGPPANGSTGTPATGDSTDLSGCYGENDATTQIYELIATLNAAENVELWFDGVWGQQEFDEDTIGNPGNGIGSTRTLDHAHWYAIATGAMISLGEKTDLNLRYGWFRDSDSYRFGIGVPGSTTRLQSVTATLAHSVTDNLTGRLEYRHDWSSIKGAEDDTFLNSSNKIDDSQDIVVAEFFYTFD